MRPRMIPALAVALLVVTPLAAAGDKKGDSDKPTHEVVYTFGISGFG